MAVDDNEDPEDLPDELAGLDDDDIDIDDDDDAGEDGGEGEGSGDGDSAESKKPKKKEPPDPDAELGLYKPTRRCLRSAAELLERSCNGPSRTEDVEDPVCSNVYAEARASCVLQRQPAS